MEYGDGLKRRILESRHQFIYGVQKERSAYLKSFSNCSYFENSNDWKNYYTVNGEFIEYIHDYGRVIIDDYKLVRTKEV